MKKNLTIAHGMMRVTLLLLLLMIPVMRLLAGPVSETQARQRARSIRILTFGDPVTTIEAGRAYIIKWEKAADYVDDNAHNIVEPTFSKVTIKSDEDGGFVDAVTDYVDFLGVYRFRTVTDDNHSILFVGAYPQRQKGCCALIIALKFGCLQEYVYLCKTIHDD